MVEASLLQVYGIDLAEKWGELGVRRLHVLIEGLPADAPLWREEVYEAEKWTQEHEIMAATLEMIDRWGYLIFSASGGKLKRPYKPYQFPRPRDSVGEGQQLRSTNRVTLADQRKIAQFFTSNN